MVPLTGTAGGWLADTAGIRALALVAEALRDLPTLFREFRPLQGGCAFADCQHLSEPGCAVIAAARSGAIDMQRYESYRRLAGATPGAAWDQEEDNDADNDVGADWENEPGQREDSWHANDG